MRFSVLVAVYNALPYLDACVQSVLAQSERDFELLLIDDGSTDGSGAVCDRYAESDKRVRVWHTSNRGVFFARAFAEEHAAGEYVLHADADDTVEADLLASLRETIDRLHPDLLFYDYTLSRPDGSTQLETFLPQDAFFEGDEMRTLYRFLLSTRFNTLCNKCFHRRLIGCAPQYLHFPRLRHGEDLLRSAYLVTGAANAAYIHCSFYTYRTGVGNARAFHADTFSYYDAVTREVETLLRGKVEWNDEWDGLLCAMRRYQLLNFIRSMTSYRVPTAEGVRLLRQSEQTPFFAGALRGAPDTLPFRLLRRGRYGTLLRLHKAKQFGVRNSELGVSKRGG